MARNLELSIRMYTLMLVLAGVCFNPVVSLRGVRIILADAVRAGSDTVLRCDYDLERAALYSIKWYRGDEEFYRYVPKEEPPARVFPAAGVSVDTTHSDARSVSLLHVTRELSGLYKCEVSADAPLFHTSIQSATLIVAEPPQGPPYITVDKDRLSGNDVLNANCSVGPAYPTLNITWFINALPIVDSPQSRILSSTSTYTPGPSPPPALTPLFMADYSSPYRSQQMYAASATAASVAPFAPAFHGRREDAVTVSSLQLSAPGLLARNGKLQLACVGQLMSLYRDTAIKDIYVVASNVGPSEPSRSTQQQRSQGRVLVEASGCSRAKLASWPLLIIATVALLSGLSSATFR